MASSTPPLNLEYFRTLTQPRMSIFATDKEQKRFTDNLLERITYEEGKELHKIGVASRGDVYNFSRSIDEYFYNWDTNRNEYILHRKEGEYVAYNLWDNTYVSVSKSNNHDKPIVSIIYLRDRKIHEDSKYGLPENYKWSRIRTKNMNYIQNYLKPSILARYAMFNRPTNGLSNVLIDSFIPKLMYQFDFQIHRMKGESNLPSTALTISPWFAELFDVKQISVEQMCRILGYTKKDIKNLLVAVRRKEHNIAFIGYGGTNVNTIHWLTEMCTMTHTINLFKSVSVFENDNLEISNLFRFPKNPEALYNSSSVISNKNKLSLLSNYELKTLSRNKPTVKSKYINRFEIRYNNNLKDAIMYGAPDIPTREMFAQNDLRFIAATHTGNSAFMHINPTQDSDITIETYGLIQLSIFFMNQLKLAITLLETLSNDEIDLRAKDVEVLNYTFSQNDSLTTDRKYNFQLDHSGHMVTEEEANAVV